MRRQGPNEQDLDRRIVLRSYKLIEISLRIRLARIERVDAQGAHCYLAIGAGGSYRLVTWPEIIAAMYGPYCINPVKAQPPAPAAAEPEDFGIE